MDEMMSNGLPPALSISNGEVTLNLETERRPGYKRKRSPLVFSLNGTWLYVGTVSLPLIGLFLTVILSMWKDFDFVNFTHCWPEVWNFLPSVSAAVSCCLPQRYIWYLLIAFHAAPRLMFSRMYYNHYMGFPVTENRRLYNILVTINMLLQSSENICLAILTYITSLENFKIHSSGFGGFVVCSILYMILTLVIFNWSRSSYPDWSKRDLKSFQHKKRLFSFNMFCICMVMYLYWRHNAYCEPGVYSICAFFEYLFILSNMLFHLTAIHECGEGDLVFTEVPISKLLVNVT